MFNKMFALISSLWLSLVALAGTTVTYTLTGTELSALQEIWTDLPPSILNIFLTIIASMLWVIVVYFAFKLIQRYI